MKAAIVPSANSTWQVKETKTPEPGEDQVLIKIHAMADSIAGLRPDGRLVLMGFENKLLQCIPAI